MGNNQFSCVVEGDHYELRFPYDQKDAFKMYIPGKMRSWDGDKKVWMVDFSQQNTLARLFPGNSIPAPTAGNSAPTLVQKTLKVRYIGQVKDQYSGDMYANCLIEDYWSLQLPEEVLKMFWEGTVAAPRLNMSSLYGILTVTNTATIDEIKTGYRKMAKQWNPDYCAVPNANEIFQKIQDAYKILTNTYKRLRYNVGLLLEAQSKATEERYGTNVVYGNIFQPPYRCGLITLEGEEKLGKIRATKITDWKDIVNDRGQTLVSSWDSRNNRLVENWL